jgi:cell fate regulator YaaT (PSP1 superfamily)
MSLDKPSIYYDAYRELVKIYTNNYGFSKKDAVNYFSNAGRSDFMNISQDSITKLFKENKLEQPSINFVLEM